MERKKASQANELHNRTVVRTRSIRKVIGWRGNRWGSIIVPEVWHLYQCKMEWIISISIQLLWHVGKKVTALSTLSWEPLKEGTIWPSTLLSSSFLILELKQKYCGRPLGKSSLPQNVLPLLKNTLKINIWPHENRFGWQSDSLSYKLSGSIHIILSLLLHEAFTNSSPQSPV